MQSDTEPKKRFKVYTRTGDGGSSSLFTGERRDKWDRTFEVLGDTDELNAAVGLAREYVRLQDHGPLDAYLERVQCHLLDLGSHIATPAESARASPWKVAHTSFPDAAPELEAWIDGMDAELPPLSQFILPSGGLASSHLHLARTVCRRAERHMAELVRDGEVSAEAGRWLNRLSDFLFVAARYAAQLAGRPETTYKKQSPPE